MAEADTIDNATETVAPSTPAAVTPADSAPAPTDGETDSPPADGEEGQPAKPSASVQKSINRLTRQRAEAERRAMRAEARLEAFSTERSAQTAAPQPSAAPKQSDFATYEEFVAARARFEGREAAREEIQQAQQKDTARRAGEAAQQSRQAFEREASAQAKAAGIDFEDDWDTLLKLPQEDVSEAFAAGLYGSDEKAQLVHFFAENLDEVRRISDLSPLQAVRELARLEVRLGTKASPRTTRAPAPVRTVGGSSSAAQNDPSKMSMEDYAEWRAKRPS